MTEERLLILADNYVEARNWAVEHGYPEREIARNRGGQAWLFIGPHSDSRLRGTRGGRFVDLRHAQRGLPPGAVGILKRAGFVEVGA